MVIEVKYVVIQRAKEEIMFHQQKAVDAYDKMFDGGSVDTWLTHLQQTKTSNVKPFSSIGRKLCKELLSNHSETG